MKKLRPIIILLSVLSAVLYNSWPLGYSLDPGVIEHSYLSVLEVSGRPYRWVFVLCDVLATTLALIIGILIWRSNKPARNSLIGFIVFSLATYFEALLPIDCTGSIKACGTSLSQVLSIHDTASILSAFGLLASLWLCVRFARRYKLDNKYYKLSLASFWAWSLSGLFLIASVGLNRFSEVSQIVFVVMCGLAIISIALILSLPGKQKT